MSLADDLLRLWGRPRVRVGVTTVAFAALTAVTYLIAHPRVFTGFSVWDDEGYMLTALKAFIDHGDLYDRVYTQYGPFYYEAWGGVFSLLGIPVTHEGGRAVVMLVWILTGLTLGVAAMRMTASLFLGLAVQMLVFASLWVLTSEPMHPGGIICLLLASIVAISCLVGDRTSPYAMAGLGAVVVALALVKINVGFFAVAALAFACVVSFPVLYGRRWLRPVVEVAFVSIPVLLMLGKFDEAWVRRYALHVALAALAVVIVLRARESERRPTEELIWLLGGFVAVGTIVCLTIIAAGTSPSGLIDGVLLQPLGQADAFTAPMLLSTRFYGLDLLALGGACVYWYASTRRVGPPGGPWLAMTSLFSIGVGFAMSLTVAGKLFPFDSNDVAGYPLSMLGFCWVALVAPPPGSPTGVSFARLLLPLLAVLQALHGYPVAGSQTLWAAFLLIPVGAICVANGARGLYQALSDEAERRALLAFTGVVAVVLAWFVVNATLREPLREARAAHDAAVPLDLPGAGSIRVAPPEAELYREVTGAIERNCPALVMLPGMDSFYLWAEQEPPTDYNATSWPTLFDDDRQRRVIEDIGRIDGLCLLENVPLAEFWGAGTIPSGPLVRYMRREFDPLSTFGDYRLLRRQGEA